MMAQERNRYRYMPHIFHGYSDGDQIEDIDIQGVSGSLRESYGTTANEAAGSARALSAEHALEDRIDVLQVIAEIELGTNFFRR